MAEWDTDIDRLIDDQIDRANKFVVASVIDIMSAVINLGRGPKGQAIRETGNWRRSWYVMSGEGPMPESPEENPGRSSIREITLSLKGHELGDIVGFYNATNYAEPLEFKDGGIHQGKVRGVVIGQAQSIVDRTAARFSE